MSLPSVYHCSSTCICWRCTNRAGNYCCSEGHGDDDLDCPEYTKFQKCPYFKPIQVQSTGLNK